MEFLEINGGHGEGGGQIVRSAITLSCITRKPIHLINIRKNRKIPGLRPQHLIAIKILQKISNAKVIGAELGSTELKFIPKDVKNMDLIEDVGTAGSISLVLQVLIPVISILQKKLNLTIKGGTDVSWSPSIEYTQQVLREAYQRIGIEFSLDVIKRGYYPRGRGEIRLQVFPANIKSKLFLERKTKFVKLICSYSKLSVEKIEKEIEHIKKKLEEENFIIEVEIKNQEAIDSGASLLIYSTDKNSIIGIDSLYNKKLQKFDLDLDKFTENSLGVDKNLADMIVVPASLSHGKTVFRVGEITKHLETNLYVTSKITGCKYGIGKLPDGFEVIIEGISNSSVK